MAYVLNKVGGGGSKGATANIYVTGLSQTDTVTATSPIGKVVNGEWGSVVIPVLYDFPIMTSNTSPEGEVIADSTSNVSTFPFWRAMNGDTSNNWESGRSGTSCVGAYIGYKFGKSVNLNEVTIGLGCGNSGSLIVSFQTSLDGNKWIDIQTNIIVSSTGNGSNNIQTYNANGVECSMYRFIVTGYSSSGDNRLKCCTMAGHYSKEIIGDAYTFHATEYGTYTVTANNGTKTSTEEVLVDCLCDYYIPMSI